MPYGLLVNGQLRELQDVQYLLSPQDLAAVELVPELVRAGVTCFKIEGGWPGLLGTGPALVVYTGAAVADIIQGAAALRTLCSDDEVLWLLKTRIGACASTSAAAASYLVLSLP